MKHLSKKALNFLSNNWRLDTRTQFDRISMFWDHRRYELVCKELVTAGLVKPDVPEAVEIIEVAKSIPDSHIHDAILSLLSKYTFIKCNTCKSDFFIPDGCSVRDLLSGACANCKDTQCLALRKYQNDQSSNSV